MIFDFIRSHLSLIQGDAALKEKGLGLPWWRGIIPEPIEKNC
jgi:hypothetical protein